MMEKSKVYLDFTNLHNDLSKGFACLLDPDLIRIDPLRIIRACRIAALNENWTLSENSIEAIRENKKVFYTIAKEDIKNEILTALSYTKPSTFFRLLRDTDLLSYCIPDLASGIGCEQNEFHTEFVYDHMLRTLDESCSLTSNPLLRLACLFHDIGKPSAKSVGEDGRIHFYKHEIVGAKLVKEWMREYCFSFEDVDYVVRLISCHQWRHNIVRKSTARRWLKRIKEDLWKDLLTLNSADRMGNLKNVGKPMITNRIKDLIFYCEMIIEERRINDFKEKNAKRNRST